MKKIFAIIVLGLATLFVASAATTSAYTCGVTAGKALNSLYAQYQEDGKFDVSNSSNLLNLASLSTSITGLKSGDSTYKKNFAKGLVLGSAGLVSSSDASSITETLTSLSSLDLTSITSSLTSSSSDDSSSSSTLSSLTSLLSSLGN